MQLKILTTDLSPRDKGSLAQVRRWSAPGLAVSSGALSLPPYFLKYMLIKYIKNTSHEIENI